MLQGLMKEIDFFYCQIEQVKRWNCNYVKLWLIDFAVECLPAWFPRAVQLRKCCMIKPALSGLGNNKGSQGMDSSSLQFHFS